MTRSSHAPRALALVVVLATLVSLLASLLVTSYAATTAEAAGTHGAAPADGAHRDRAGGTKKPKRSSFTDGLTRVVVVDHNIQRRQAALNSALRRAFYAKAQLVTLQEVCWWQVANLREAHPTWSIVYQSDTTSGMCKQTPGLGNLGEADREDSGNVVIWTGGAKAERSVHVFKAQAKRGFKHGMACLRWRTKTVVDVCSVHLVHAGEDKARKKIQLRQAKELAAITTSWITAKHLVVVAGDFNNGPTSRPLDFMFKSRGEGRFLEATRCQRVWPLCRKTEEITLDGGKQKIDYVFFSTNRTSRRAPYWLDLTRTLSDHHLLTGSAWVDLRKVRGGRKAAR